MSEQNKEMGRAKVEQFPGNQGEVQIPKNGISLSEFLDIAKEKQAVSKDVDSEHEIQINGKPVKDWKDEKVKPEDDVVVFSRRVCGNI